MANYYGKTRTNYFHVTDTKKFMDIMSKCCNAEREHPTVITEDDQPLDQGPNVGFYTDGTIVGYFDETDTQPDIRAFIQDMQEVLAPDDACILTEIGFEKMRYLFANSLVITKKETARIDLNEASKELAGKLLGNPKWDSRFDY